MRNNASNEFQKIFEKVSSLANELSIEIVTPRLAIRQRNRCNVNTQSCEDYYRIAIFIPLLDEIIADIKDRFPPETLGCFDLNLFIPAVIVNTSTLDLNKIESVGELFQKFLASSFHGLIGEFKVWSTYWKNVNSDISVPATAIETLNITDKNTFPAVYTLLQILATFPVSVASAERSFSSLRRLKTWLRSNMSEERLTGLALLNLHRDIDVSIDDVIDRFARKKNRRLEFIV